MKKRRSKERQIIKRLYEKGRETTVSAEKKTYSAKRHTARPEKIEFKAHIPRPAAVELKKPPAKPDAIPERAHSPAKRVIVDDFNLPSHYGATKLILMAKDPLWIYAYWEIAQDSIARLRNVISQEEIERSRTILRMYDVSLVDFNGSNANRSFDIEVGRDANNWYINLWNDSVSYVGEIGFRSEDGRFFPVTRSNCITTPRLTYSPRTEQIWMKVEESAPVSAYVVSGFKLPKPSRDVPPQAAPEHYSRRRKKIIYISEDEIRGYYDKLSPLLREVIAPRIRIINKPLGYGKKTEFYLEGETKEERTEILSRLPKEYFIRRMILSSSLDVIVLGGGSEERMRGPGGSSDFVRERIRQRGFFFEIGTELIVYGRTEPDAEVYLGNKKVDLRKDGTFTLRFALPDGKIPLEFTAISNDKEATRKINTYVERRPHS